MKWPNYNTKQTFSPWNKLYPWSIYQYSYYDFTPLMDGWKLFNDTSAQIHTFEDIKCHIQYTPVITRMLGSTSCRSCYSKQDRALSDWWAKGENREFMYSFHLAPSLKITYSCVFNKCSSFVDDLNINLTSVFVWKIKQNCTNSNNYVRLVIFILQK